MGAWSTKIFDNDLSMDILTEYKILLGYKVTPDDAYEKIKERYEKDFVGEDDEDDYWLAIAYFQWKNGILNSEVKENALRCIDDEQFLERWKESGTKVYEKRKTVLKEFKDNLINVVNPKKKHFPKCPAYLREKIPFKVGDIILYQLKKPLYGEGSEPWNKAREFSEKICGKYFLLKVVGINKRPVSNICPELDYTSSAVIMVYDWIGSHKPSINEIELLSFKKMCSGVEFVSFDLEKMEMLETPYYIKKICPAYQLDSISYLKIGELCEIEIIGNDVSTDIEKIDLWQEYPYAITLSAGFNAILIRSFTDYDYPEEWW